MLKISLTIAQCQKYTYICCIDLNIIKNDKLRTIYRAFRVNRLS